MNQLWNYVKGLFESTEKSSPSQPVIHELIKRSEEEITDFEQWKQTLVAKRMLNWLSEQYVIFGVRPNDIDEAIDFLDTASSKGFVVHFFKTRYSNRDVQHLFDLLKSKVRGLGYRTQISDTRTFAQNDQVVTIERHYLKPPPSFGQHTSGQLDQRFGNVMIEHELRNDKPHYLKFRATTYRDSQFLEPRTFQELMKEILV
jgi:hypothetical protein